MSHYVGSQHKIQALKEPPAKGLQPQPANGWTFVEEVLYSLKFLHIATSLRILSILTYLITLLHCISRNLNLKLCSVLISSWLDWLGHVVHMEENVPSIQVYNAGICGSWQRERSFLNCTDQIEDALSSIGVTNWRGRTRSKGTWEDVLRQAVN